MAITREERARKAMGPLGAGFAASGELEFGSLHGGMADIRARQEADP